MLFLGLFLGGALAVGVYFLISRHYPKNELGRATSDVIWRSARRDIVIIAVVLGTIFGGMVVYFAIPSSTPTVQYVDRVVTKEVPIPQQAPAYVPMPAVPTPSASFTTPACAGIKHTVVLQPGVWVDVDKFNACRVMSAPPPGVAIEAMDPTGAVFNLLPNGEVARDAVRVRSVNTTVQFSYSRCPKGLPGMRNWDCSPL